MVDLPGVSRRNPTTDQIQNRVTPGDVAAPFQAFSDAIGSFTPGIDKLGEHYGEKAGFESAVTTGADGLPELRQMPPMAGTYGAAYNRAAKWKYLADMGTAVEKKIFEAKIEHAGNPAGFKKWAESYGKTLLRTTRDPELRASVEKLVNDSATEAWKGLTADYQKTVTAGALTSLGARRDTIENRMAALARAGGTGTPEYRAAMADYEAIGREITENPALGVPKEKVAADRTVMLGRQEAEAVIGAIGRSNLPRGGPDLNRARAAIASIESGGKYSILGPVLASGDRAYGKYQVMGANIPSWTRQTFGKEMTTAEFLANPEAQDAVFDTIFGGYVQQYGNVSDAASAWFTGRPLAEGADAKDVFGTTGSGYVRKFLTGYSDGTTGTDAGTELETAIWDIPDLSPEDRRRYIAWGQTELNKVNAESQRASGVVAEQYERAIIDSSAGVGPMIPRQEIETDPTLSEGSRNTLLKAYDTASKDIITQQRAYDRFASPDGGGFNPFESDDRTAIDGIYKTLGADGAALKTIVDRTGIAPPMVVKGLRGDLTSTDPARVGTALQISSNLMAANPSVYAGQDGANELETATTTFRHYVDDLGYTADQASQKIALANDPDHKAKIAAQVKNEDVDQLVKKHLAVADIEKAFDTSILPDGTISGRPDIGFSPDARQGMFTDYAELFRDRYMENGNVDLSKTLAQNQLKRLWGVTAVNGSSVVVRYPPERAPGMERLDDPASLIADDALESIRGESFAAPASPAGQVEPGNITDLMNRKQLNNQDGTISTTSSISFEEDGKEVLIPTVVDGKRLTDAEAEQHYRDTGQHLGKFKDATTADAYATALHNQQAVALNLKREDIRMMPLPGITAGAYKSGQPVPYMLGWENADGIIDWLNPGRAFILDPKALALRQTEARAAAFEAKKAEPPGPLEVDPNNPAKRVLDYIRGAEPDPAVQQRVEEIIPPPSQPMNDPALVR